MSGLWHGIVDFVVGKDAQDAINQVKSLVNQYTK